MKVFAIIVAAGKGLRFSKEKKVKFAQDLKTGTCKQFICLGGKPVFAHAIKPFDDLRTVDEIVLVVPKGKVNYCKSVINEFRFKKNIIVVEGGVLRQDSVLNGLNAIKGKDRDIVLVHDGARPLITKDLIEKCISAAEKNGASIVAIPVTDTIKSCKKDLVEDTLDRNRLWSVQTPQGFKLGLLKKAFDFAKRHHFVASDDAFMIERLGRKVNIVQGSSENIKITTPIDLFIAEKILKFRKNS